MDKTYRFLPALAGLLACLVMGALWASGHRALFQAIETQWGVWPGDYPFSDLEGALSGIECKRRGIDPYISNPCDSWGRQFDYPPAWLWLTVLPVTTAWLVPAGLALTAAFLGSLLLLPAPRGAQGARITAAAVLSSVTLFAVERGNNDLVVFILVACAAALLARGRAGLWPYALVQLAGLLKYFPLAAMAMAFTEAPRRFLAVAAASLAATGLFVATHHAELASALDTIPFGSPFRLVYGASNLGGGLIMLGAPEIAAHAFTAVLIVAALAGGAALGLRPAAAAAIQPLTRAERLFLLAGAAMVLGTFFTAQNIDYRAVHMLLMVPTLVALRDCGAPRRYATLAFVALALLWMDFFRLKILALAYSFTGLAQQLIEAIPGFLVREALWWWLVVHTLALTVALLREAPVVEWALSSTRRGAAGS